MYNNINSEKLREDLTDYFGTAMTGGFPAAVIDLGEVDTASQDELINIAKKNGFDLDDYDEDEDEEM